MTMQFINIKVIVFLALLGLSSQSFAEKLTLQKMKSLVSSAKSGQFRVIVEFKDEAGLPVTSDLSSDRRVMPNNAASQNEKEAYLLGALKRQSRSQAKENLRGRYIRHNLRTLSVSREELTNLVNDNGLTVYEDKLHRPSLASSVNVVFPNQSTSAYSGAGQTVVILDTGVNKNHSFLSGAVISAAEACFSNAPNDPNFVSLCPNGQASMIGTGAAAACDSSVAACAHGTQMAGVIAGQGANFSGVGTSTTIIPIQIYAQSNDELVCGDISLTPCLTTSTSDIISALDYINSIKNSHSIAAVNISAATTITYQGQCDGQEPSSYISAISDLTASNIAVIASSGNGAQANEMASPACIEDVIAVAATDDNDVAWSLNNRNSELDFFAPGVSVTTSSLPNNSFSVVSGTSVAAAHVSGAWAVMKSKSPAATVASIKNTLTNTGKLVTQGLFSKRRINITSALGEVVVQPDSEFEDSYLPAIYLLLGDD